MGIFWGWEYCEGGWEYCEGCVLMELNGYGMNMGMGLNMECDTNMGKDLNIEGREYMGRVGMWRGMCGMGVSGDGLNMGMV